MEPENTSPTSSDEPHQMEKYGENSTQYTVFWVKAENSFRLIITQSDSEPK